MKPIDNTTIRESGNVAVPVTVESIPKTVLVESIPKSVLLARIQQRLDEYWAHK
jgi:hypothetical protein